MLSMSASDVVGGPLGLAHKLVTICLDIIVVHLGEERSVEICGEIFSSTWNFGLEPRPDDTGVRVRHSDEEIWGGLTIGRFVAHVPEVLACTVSWSEVCHPAFIDDTDFVKDLV